MQTEIITAIQSENVAKVCIKKYVKYIVCCLTSLHTVKPYLCDYREITPQSALRGF